jgi:glutathione-regulated potassium-efflux system protein KefB
MAGETSGIDLVPAIALLGAGVVAVPLFKRIGLGAVVGYLAAGIAIGPFGLRLFTEPASILSVAQLGVVMLLFVIGLELKPSRLWALRRDIFGLGVAQVVFSVIVLAAAGMAVGGTFAAALIGAMGLALSSTAIVMQILEERGETTEPHGQKIFAVLLLQDLAIVPLLAIVTLLSPIPAQATVSPTVKIVIALVAVAGIIAVGRYLLNPVFRIFADTKAREVMTAAALLVVLGAAFAMQAGGLSMAMGAFLAGVLLSESSFRHQLEADIEPFRGLLLGLFFLGVGMSLDLRLILSEWLSLIGLVIGFMVLKTLAIYAVARVRSKHNEALRIALLLPQGGEFAFVLYAAAAESGIFSAEMASLLTAAVILSMALTPLAPYALKLLIGKEAPSMDGIDVPEGLTGTALVIGFGRFGQVASQMLLARQVDVSIIDSDTEMIRVAARFGFKIYYGDGTRLDVLRAAGAGSAKIIAICIDDRAATDRIVELVNSEFPVAELYVRSFDRGHTLSLIGAGVAYEIRETFESAMAFGEATLRGLGFSPEEAAATASDVRERDRVRLQIQQAEGIYAGREYFRPTPAPLTPPKRSGRPLSEQTAVLAEEGEGEGKAEEETVSQG